MKEAIRKILLDVRETTDDKTIDKAVEQLHDMLSKTATPMPLVGLPNGVVLNISKVGFIARKELNQYVVFLEGLPTGPVIGLPELEALEAYGILQPLKVPEKPAEEAKVIKLVKDEK